MAGDTEATFVLSLDDDNDDVAVQQTKENTFDVCITLPDVDCADQKATSMSLEQQLMWCKSTELQTLSLPRLLLCFMTNFM
ncbi:hypothetical protein AHF37_12651 [Paragonimus kellicotti]|nr:hypothetical protein AHF37_12651 [Paragonimus kellicotti]